MSKGQAPGPPDIEPALSPPGSPHSSLHVHDLPQLYQKPSASRLLNALALLSTDASTFVTMDKDSRVTEQGVPRYLTSIVSSNLGWIDDDLVKESIWSAASARLSERSGRNAMPAMTRVFIVNERLSFHLHEPSLTEDNLGLKTWSSSLLLSQRLPKLSEYIVQGSPRVLELGAGTGLVGMAAACIWSTDVWLTDLPEIVVNLQRNLEQNRDLIERNHGRAVARPLDWSDEAEVPSDDEERFMIILAADPIYSSDHPKMLVTTVHRWIHPHPDARFIVELPLRDRYDKERQSLKDNLRELDFELVAEGLDMGYDDWRGQDGRLAEVQCWWSVWRLVQKT